MASLAGLGGSENEKQMVGGCCVCADDTGYGDNLLVYCDGPDCEVAVHQACYGIGTVPEGNWYCRRCEHKLTAAATDRESAATQQLCCQLCPQKLGALKRTDTGRWAHIVCALYIPEIAFGNVRTMEPIITKDIRPERFNKKCSICESTSLPADALGSDTNDSTATSSETPGGTDGGGSGGGGGAVSTHAYVNCGKAGCKHWFHVTCAQANGLLCETSSTNATVPAYCIYCKKHFPKPPNGGIKRIPAFKLESVQHHNETEKQQPPPSGKNSGVTVTAAVKETSSSSLKRKKSSSSNLVKEPAPPPPPAASEADKKKSSARLSLLPSQSKAKAKDPSTSTSASTAKPPPTAAAVVKLTSPGRSGSNRSSSKATTAEAEAEKAPKEPAAAAASTSGAKKPPSRTKSTSAERSAPVDAVTGPKEESSSGSSIDSAIASVLSIKSGGDLNTCTLQQQQSHDSGISSTASSLCLSSGPSPSEDKPPLAQVSTTSDVHAPLQVDTTTTTTAKESAAVKRKLRGNSSASAAHEEPVASPSPSPSGSKRARKTPGVAAVATATTTSKPEQLLKPAAAAKKPSEQAASAKPMDDDEETELSFISNRDTFEDLLYKQFDMGHQVLASALQRSKSHVDVAALLKLIDDGKNEQRALEKHLKALDERHAHLAYINNRLGNVLGNEDAAKPPPASSSSSSNNQQFGLPPPPSSRTPSSSFAHLTGGGSPSKQQPGALPTTSPISPSSNSGNTTCSTNPIISYLNRTQHGMSPSANGASAAAAYPPNASVSQHLLNSLNMLSAAAVVAGGGSSSSSSPSPMSQPHLQGGPLKQASTASPSTTAIAEILQQLSNTAVPTPPPSSSTPHQQQQQHLNEFNSNHPHHQQHQQQQQFQMSSKQLMFSNGNGGNGPHPSSLSSQNSLFQSLNQLNPYFLNYCLQSSATLNSTATPTTQVPANTTTGKSDSPSKPATTQQV